MYDFEDQSNKSRVIALLLCWLFGVFGVHRFYVGRFVSGFLMLFTLGGLGLWALIDFIRIAFGFFSDADGFRLRGSAALTLVLACGIIGASTLIPRPEINLGNLVCSSDLKQSMAEIIRGPTPESRKTAHVVEVPRQVVSSASNIIRYRDEKGSFRYVDSIDKVPEKYRGTVDEAHKLPAITKTRFGAYDGKKASDSDKVEIYVTEWCPHCSSLERYLKEKKVAYQRYDIEKDSSARQRYKKLGGAGVPLARVGSKILRGFDSQALDAALNKVN